MPNDDIEVALGVDRIVATLRRWARNANEQGAHEAVLGLLVAADEIERTRAERDEAQRMVCIMKAQSVTYAFPPEHFAKQHGWDCFPEATP